MNPITRDHRLAVARAWEGSELLALFLRAWVESGSVEADTPFARVELRKCERLAQLVADAEGAWIPCEERRPSADMEFVIATTGWDSSFEAWYDGKWWRSHNADGPLKVTHWRPLPKPPEQP